MSNCIVIIFLNSFKNNSVKNLTNQKIRPSHEPLSLFLSVNGTVKILNIRTSLNRYLGKYSSKKLRKPF